MANTWLDEIRTDLAHEAYWSSQAVNAGTAINVAATPDLVRGSKCQIVWTRDTPGGLREDVMVTSIAFCAAVGTGGAADSTELSDSQKAAREGDLTTMLTTLQSLMASSVHKLSYRWHEIGCDIARPGPATRVAAATLSGTDSANARLPDQVALDTTFRTCSRKHWGRNYWPGWTLGAFITSGYGHCKATTVDTLALAVRTMVNAAETATTPVQVWSQQYRGFLAIKELDVDDTFDIIRRRRPKFPSYRKVYVN
jgi:hypothetical protein